MAAGLTRHLRNADAAPGVSGLECAAHHGQGPAVGANDRPATSVRVSSTWRADRVGDT